MSPNGSTEAARLALLSICLISARRDSMAEEGGKILIDLWALNELYVPFMFCSVGKRVKAVKKAIGGIPVHHPDRPAVEA
jgi:hypothetical protein